MFLTVAECNGIYAVAVGVAYIQFVEYAQITAYLVQRASLGKAAQYVDSRLEYGVAAAETLQSSSDYAVLFQDGDPVPLL